MAHQQRLKTKKNLILRVNYISSALSLVFGFMCIYFLNITEVIPYVFFLFSLLNLANTFAFKKHQNLSLMYNVTSLVTLFSCIVITLFSGGINSAFIFVLGLVAFAGYVTTKRYGEVYLYSAFIIVTLIYFQSILSLPFVRNVVPEASQDLFNFISILFSLYILGGVFGKILVKTHYNLYRSKLEVEQKVREKETLIKEVHHRVKNNLQTVSSLLSLQARNMKDEEMKKMIKSSQNRVNSMAMVHEMLYMREDLSKIEYKSYVEELSDYLVRSIKGTDNRIKVAIDIIDINLGIDTAIPLGLLINEAITNSLKYGIKDNGEGEISIALKKSQDEKDYVLNIGDNGDGYEESITPQTTTSLGLKLIYNLTRQLQGSILKDCTKKGTNYIITFKEIGQNFQPIG
ncbi:Two-component sensor histidine kinase, contains HisKA and HATPase domains [Cellulophaga baltica]|uniref:histidine kinase n=2 Tax=Cellulophaga baltica TaxID=76594 RepID=A0A1G7IGW9_9FLAO|nr:Two-component sensor histidine kinase, contains HisKA and HATPase domains [Cellulophaga baltica]